MTAGAGVVAAAGVAVVAADVATVTMGAVPPYLVQPRGSFWQSQIPASWCRQLQPMAALKRPNEQTMTEIWRMASLPFFAQTLRTVASSTWRKSRPLLSAIH